MAGMEVDDGPTKVGGKRGFSRSGITGRGWVGQQVCRYWQEGRCIRGEDCQWVHPDGAGPTGRPHASNGLANKRPSNVIDNRVDNRLDNRGGFSDGASGGFSSGSGARRNPPSAKWGRPHSKNNRAGGRTAPDVGRRPRDKVCSFWLKGNCQRGDECNYLHAHTANSDINLIKQLDGHGKTVRAIELPHGSSHLYSGGLDQTLRVWDCNTGECTNVVPMGGDVGALLSAATWLFVGLPNEVKIWDMQTQAQQSLSGPQGMVHSLAVSADMLFAGIQDGSVLAWKFSTITNAFEPAASLLGHNGAVITLMIHGSQLFSGSIDKSIKVWDLGTGQCVQTLQGHTHVVMRLLVWDKFLLSCSLDGTVRVWGPNSEGFFESRYTHPEDNDVEVNPRSVELAGALTMCGTMDSSGKPVLICSYNDNTVHFYDLPTFSERGTIQTRDEVRAMQVGPGGLVFSGEGSGGVKVWRFADAATS
ncbi:protein MpC3H30 [Marchantia polymorpha subsp. ruderalis]|uniref:C3H1-type domain-containing protein n=2 Tax=Marchantia polymorpha TaxID=3197 RepID=A0AAF6C150_MARPO|nr:hypothetical protein MARPO_0165s0013 [Marchantia polymorpha]BBN17984.1 hypothetical protein Mp_7g18530 [Marchantia polymorpha subsp. ruderalis]|eukprot:PTQ28386.1 hypothetical protein MARPO_0165s0013 [Marchantia polymorpha]